LFGGLLEEKRKESCACEALGGLLEAAKKKKKKK
jgi:hypothetical protein